MKKETLKQHAYNIIKDKIINCEYAPSALLNEEMLKEDVQASRTPIRDALGRLEQEGLVTILPKKGIMVAPLTIREINMVHEARTLIEPFAILHYGNKISDEIYQNYFRIFQRDTANVSDLNEYYETDKQFHQMFIDATSNDYLISTYERIAQQNTRYRRDNSNANGINKRIDCLRVGKELGKIAESKMSGIVHKCINHYQKKRKNNKYR